MLAYTNLPGYWGSDEEESDLTLGFWYLFQEALWSVDPEFEDDETAIRQSATPEGEQATVSRAVYYELVVALRRKVEWPNRQTFSYWTRGQSHSLCNCV